MLVANIEFVICVLICAFAQTKYCYGQYSGYKEPYALTATVPLPFPACQAVDVACQRRGLRTFFFLMDSGHLGMKPVDPTILNSVAVSYPEPQISVMIRRLNVTGARWTKLVERKFNLQDNRSGVKFLSDIHIVGDLLVTIAERYNPLTALITMDLADIETNVTYKWNGERGIDNEDYLIIGQERIAVRNSRVPTYFLQPDGADAYMINQIFQTNPNVLEHLGIEIQTALMHSIVDNFRLFARTIPVKYYYQYYSNK